MRVRATRRSLERIADLRTSIVCGFERNAVVVVALLVMSRRSKQLCDSISPSFT
jgi:hypothetical protein